MGNRRTTKSETTGAHATGGSPRKPVQAKPTAQPARRDPERPKLYEKPPQDLIDFVEQRSKPIELPPLKKRAKGRRGD